MAVVVLATAGFITYRELSPTPVQRIEKVIDRAARAVEAESILRLGEILSIQFQGPSGIDRAMVLQYLQKFFSEADEVSVSVLRIVHDHPDLPESATEARAIVVVEISGKTSEDKQEFRGIGSPGGDAVEVHFQNRDGRWLVTAARRLDASSAGKLTEQLN